METLGLTPHPTAVLVAILVVALLTMGIVALAIDEVYGLITGDPDADG